MDIRVLGLGNVLMGDDGFGPYVIEALNAAFDFPPQVSVIDIGTPGLDLAPYLMGSDAVIVLDTVRSDGAPGCLRRYSRDELLAHPPEQRLGPHDPGFRQMLFTLDFAGIGPPEVVLLGVIPKTTAPCARLSDPVRRAVPAAIRAVIAELQRMGGRASRRAVSLPVVPWWEQPVHV